MSEKLLAVHQRSFFTQSAFPATIVLDSCTHCNLRCSMCDHVNMHKYRKHQIMDFALFERLVDEIAQTQPSIRVWLIFFGEPCLCPDMPKRITLAKERGLLDVVLNSNATLLTPEKSEAYIKAGLDSLYIGIDAVTQETYSSLRVKGKLDDSIAHALAYRDALGRYGHKEQKLFVQFIESDENAHEKQAFLDFWTKEGITIKIRPRISWAGLVDTAHLTQKKEQRLPCYWAMTSMIVCADGTVPLCPVDVHRRAHCGDVTVESIADTWQKGLLAKYRECHVAGEFTKLPQMCRDCMDWQSAWANFTEPQKGQII